jgi:uncharacterized protein YjbJ (UPF0337 family)
MICLHVVAKKQNDNRCVPSDANLAQRLLSFKVGRIKRTSITIKKGDKMKSSTTDNVEGKMHQVKGKVKEVAGKITNDPDLEAEGKGEVLAGKVQEKIGELKKIVEE